MKKIPFIFLLVALLILSAQPVFATGQSEIEYLDDGSYFTTTLENAAPTITPYASKSITKSKRVEYHNSAGKTLWHVKVTGKFTYNGKSATCTSSSVSAASSVSPWKVSDKKSWKSKNKAYASAIGRQYQNGAVVKSIPKTVTLTCSPNGNCS